MLYRWDENEYKVQETATELENSINIALPYGDEANHTAYVWGSPFSYQYPNLYESSTVLQSMPGSGRGYNVRGKVFFTGLPFRQEPTSAQSNYVYSNSHNFALTVSGKRNTRGELYVNVSSEGDWPINRWQVSVGGGDFIQYVYSADSSAFPTNGKQGDYWYNFDYINKGD